MADDRKIENITHAKAYLESVPRLTVTVHCDVRKIPFTYKGYAEMPYLKKDGSISESRGDGYRTTNPKHSAEAAYIAIARDVARELKDTPYA